MHRRRDERDGELLASRCGERALIAGLLQIHPAAKFASTVKAHGGKVAVFNLGRTKGDDEADFLFLGPCEEWLPKALGVPVPAPASNA